MNKDQKELFLEQAKNLVLEKDIAELKKEIEEITESRDYVYKNNLKLAGENLSYREENKFLKEKIERIKIRINNAFPHYWRYIENQLEELDAHTHVGAKGIAKNSIEGNREVISDSSNSSQDLHETHNKLGKALDKKLLKKFKESLKPKEG